MPTFHGVIPFLKPPGMTSHDAVAHVRRVLKVKRVGHTGTLDPAATGVLPICVGQATRLVEVLQSGTKRYLAEATFGYETDTLDAVGHIIRECGCSHINEAALERACAGFRGSTEQQPPMHSAIKLEGHRLYEVARAGGEVEIPKRPVHISELSITLFQGGTRPRAFLDIECSGGTYIRSLTRDIGRSLDCAATMTFLTRTRNGRFDLLNTITPQEFEKNPMVTPLIQILEEIYGSAIADDEIVMALSQGRRVNWQQKEFRERAMGQCQLGQLLLWSNMERTLMALTILGEDEMWKPEKVFDLRGKDS